MIMRIWLVCRNTASGQEPGFGAWHSTAWCGHTPAIEAVHAFTSESDAWLFLMGHNPTDAHVRAMKVAWSVLPFDHEARS